MPRTLAFAVVTLPLLAGCAASPQSLGLTGAQPIAPPPVANDATIGNPGIGVDNGMDYAPSLVPSTGAGRYYGGYGY